VGLLILEQLNSFERARLFFGRLSSNKAGAGVVGGVSIRMKGFAG
jgi:hypothetical protein